ncbi:hypothetical protein [Poseidonocella sedimentorum]|uniref:Asparagine synthase n=1 Tax=Poseidonocella sedimentorum TaxID=871652 RepID=A0A1I6DFE1_9RHOB|nr:hypothetical protein [Poseidonocella sedimentorum]SFR04032.1 hypothetical protein SAMN04515673_103105 [Poseidonocella sedimentorum]
MADVVAQEITAAGFGYFVYSSWAPPKSEAFSGHYIDDQNIVFGPEGFAEASACTEFDPRENEDGCYFLCRKMGGVFRIGSDFHGLMPIFIYQRRGLWAVSNSVTLLADHLLANGIRLSRNSDVLEDFDQKLYRSPQTFQTPFNEIRLTPSGSFIDIDSENIRIERPVVVQVSYKQHFEAGMSKWVSMLAALMRDETRHVVFDCTGGVDSRATVAFASHIYNSCVAEGMRLPQLFVGSGPNTQPGADLDRDIATEVSEMTGFDLQYRLQKPENAMDWKSIWQEYQLRCLGYYSLVLPRFSEMDPGELRITGLAGGFARPQNRNRNALLIARYLVGKRNIFQKFPKFLKLAREMKQLGKRFQSNRNDLLFYNEFRGRAHAGNPSQTGYRLAPLGGKDFVLAALAHDYEAVKDRQILYDMINNLAPELLKIRFDKPAKSFGPQHAERFTPVSMKIRPMRVYGKPIPTHDMKAKAEGIKFWEEVKRVFEASEVKPTEVPGKTGFVTEGLSQGIVGHSARTKQAHYVLLEEWLRKRSL